jgi:hypothetical protein
VKAFESRILPVYYKHSSFSSFLRSLCYYDFHRAPRSDCVEYSHEKFHRDHPECLSLVCCAKQRSVRPRAVPGTVCHSRVVDSALTRALTFNPIVPTTTKLVC